MERPAVSVVIPAFKEAGTILKTIERIQRLAGIEKGMAKGAVEVVVVDGDSAGSTLSALQGEPVVAIVARKGRALQMNAGAAAAQGRSLLFLHADTLLPPGAFGLISAALEHAPAGAFALSIDSPRRSLRLVSWMANLRTRLTRAPYGDQAQFFRADYFREVGGYPDMPLMEDVEIMRRVRRRGDRAAIIPVPVLTSARRWEREGVVLCTLRNWLLISLYLLGVPVTRLAGFYRTWQDAGDSWNGWRDS